MIDLTGKVALVTGAGSGFGAEISRKFASLGAKVVGGDINLETAQEVAREVAEAGGTMEATKVDVSLSDEFKAAVDRTVELHGRIDVLVNNAGITHRSAPMLDVDEETFDAVMRTNVKSIYLSAIHAVPHMAKGGGGCFINICSSAALRPRAGITWYNGTKGAALLLTKSMAIELADRNIRVVGINPVLGETNMLEPLLGGDTPELREIVKKNVPLGRLTRPPDVANAAAFLASDAAEFITGSSIEVDGGRCA